MQSLKGGGTRRTAVGVTLVALALSAGLLGASAALAGTDPLSSSSSVVLHLKSSKGLKLKPKTLTLPVNTGSALDPTTGAGTILTNKKFKAMRKGRKTKVKITQLTFGANAYSEPGNTGNMNAKVGKKKVKGFAKLSGGTLTRNGWGANLDGVTATLGKKGAKALKQALIPGKKGKGAKKASAAASGIKAGKPLGTASVTSVPETVQVLPGGTLVLQVPISGCGGVCLPFKLAGHCVNPTEPDGVTAIPPAVQSGLVGEIFTFPVTGGTIAPDFSAGLVVSAGGQLLRKNNDGSVPPAGCSSPPPVGTSITQTDFQTQFDVKALAANAVGPLGPLGLASLGTFDLGAPGASSSADVNTKQVTVTAAPVLLGSLSALLLNDTFPNESGNSAFDFVPGDQLGKISLNITTH